MKQNMQDRKRNGHHAIGEKSGRAKLNDEAVREIRAMRGIITQHALARKFGVSHTVVYDIQRGKTWKHVI